MPEQSPLDSGDETANGEPLDVSLLPGDMVAIRFIQAVYPDTSLSALSVTQLVTQVEIRF